MRLLLGLTVIFKTWLILSATSVGHPADSDISRETTNTKTKQELDYC